MSSLTDLARRAERVTFRPPPIRLTIVPVVIVVLVLFLFGYRLAYASRIYPGIQIRGVAIGGQSPEAARASLLAALEPADRTPVTVTFLSSRWALPRARLGGTSDIDRLVDLAFSFGRQGSSLEQVTTSVVPLLSPRDLAPFRDLHLVDWPSLLGPIRSEVDRPAVDATIRITSAHRVEIRPDVDGVQLDLDAAKRLISASVIAESTDPVRLPVEAVSPTTRANDLKPLQRQIQKVLSAPISLTFDGTIYEYSIDQIHSTLVLPTPAVGNTRTLQIDPVAVARFVDGVASAIDRPPRDATVVLEDEHVVVHPGQTARRVNRPATIARMNAAFFVDSRLIAVVVEESPPTIGEKDLSAIADRANTVIGASIVLRGPDQKSWSLSPADLRRMLILPGGPLIASDDRPQLDEARLTAFVTKVAADVDTPPLNARFGRATNGQIQVIRPAVSGRRLVQGDAIDAIARASESSKRAVSLPIRSIEPRVTDSEAAALSRLSFLAENVTSYVGSIPPRRHNVELATSLLNGVVVAPGEIFSFNREMGPTTLERGFQVGYGIQAQGDSVKTVPSVAGGICQVATTLFQPVFWGGYTVEERYSHLYWIAHYVSRGLVGLDTTVDEEAGLDFRFKNDTASDLLIQTATDGSSVHFSLWGVAPTWKVQVDKPVISSVVKTDPKPVLQPDPTMPKGQKVATEAAQDGFNVLVRRTVTAADGTFRQLDLRSSYLPSHNVIMVGTRT
jgi:vancomycin resistance protein YoaR